MGLVSDGIGVVSGGRLAFDEISVGVAVVTRAVLFSLASLLVEVAGVQAVRRSAKARTSTVILFMVISS
jgi:hypothetical protein